MVADDIHLQGTVTCTGDDRLGGWQGIECVLSCKQLRVVYGC